MLKYDLMSEQEFGAAADRLVNKFEQLIVSDNFVPFLGQWAVRAMQDSKADSVSELMSAPPLPPPCVPVVVYLRRFRLLFRVEVVLCAWICVHEKGFCDLR